MLLVALAFAVAAGTGHLLPTVRAARLGLLFLAGFVGWTFLSMLWAESQGASWEAAAKLLMVLAGCWTLSLLPWTANRASAFVGAWAVGVAVVCLVALLQAPGAADLGGLRTVGRLTAPTGYTNSVAALAWMSFFPALLLSFRAGLPAAVQGIGLGAAVFLLQFGLLPQSRGALVAMVLATLVLVAASPDRLRLLLRLAVTGVLLALSSQAILDVQQAADVRRGVEPALNDATGAIAITTLAGALLGAVIGWCERWTDHRPAWRAGAPRGHRIGGSGMYRAGGRGPPQCGLGVRQPRRALGRSDR